MSELFWTLIGIHLLVALVVWWVNAEGNFASTRTSFVRGLLWPLFGVYILLNRLFEDHHKEETL